MEGATSQDYLDAMWEVMQAETSANNWPKHRNGCPKWDDTSLVVVRVVVTQPTPEATDVFDDIEALFREFSLGEPEEVEVEEVSICPNCQHPHAQRVDEACDMCGRILYVCQHCPPPSDTKNYYLFRDDTCVSCQHIVWRCHYCHHPDARCLEDEEMNEIICNHCGGMCGWT